MYSGSDEILLRSVVRGHLAYEPANLSEALLREGMTDGLFKDAVQFVIGAAAEYGLGTVTLPAAGAGLAVGPTVETIVDAAFAAEGVASTVSAISNVGSMMKEYGALWDEAVAAYGGDLKEYYNTLIKIIQKALSDLGKKAGDAVDDLAEKLQGGIKKLISKLVDALKAGIKLIIPDATIGVAAAKAFQAVMDGLANNAYDLLVSAVEKVDMLKSFIQDPSIAVDFFESIFDQVVKLMIEAGKKLNDMSWASAIMKGGLGGGAVLKKLGPTGMQKGAELLSKQAPKVLDVIDKVLTVVVPTAVTAVALFQALITGDWKKDMDEGGEEGKKQESYNMKITKKALRKLIKEAMESKAEFPDVSHPSLSPYVDKLKYNIKGKPGQWFTEYAKYENKAGGQSPQGITVYHLPNGMYTARVNGSYNNTLSGKVGEEYNAGDAIEAALDSSPSNSGPSARELLKKVGEKVTPPNWYGHD